MEIRTRCVCVGASVLAWATWLGSAWYVRMHDDPEPLASYLSDVTRTMAIVFTVSTVLAFVVAPRIGMAMAWRQIGAEEQRRHCQTCRSEPDKKSNLIPLRFNGPVSRIDIRSRDN